MQLGAQQGRSGRFNPCSNCCWLLGYASIISGFWIGWWWGFGGYFAAVIPWTIGNARYPTTTMKVRLDKLQVSSGTRREAWNVERPNVNDYHRCFRRNINTRPANGRIPKFTYSYDRDRRRYVIESYYAGHRTDHELALRIEPTGTGIRNHQEFHNTFWYTYLDILKEDGDDYVMVHAGGGRYYRERLRDIVGGLNAPLRINQWFVKGLTERNTYLGEFSLQRACANNRYHAGSRVYALFSTMKRLNELYYANLANPPPQNNTSRSSWARLHRSRFGRWIGLHYLHKGVTGAWTGVTGPFRKLSNSMPRTATIEVTPWIPGGTDRGAIQTWAEGLPFASWIVDELDSEDPSLADGNSHGGWCCQRSSKESSEEPRKRDPKKKPKRDPKKATGGSDNKKKQGEPAGGSTCTNGSTSDTNREDAGNSVEESAFQKLKRKWSELHIGIKIAIIAGIVIVLILSIIGCYCCCCAGGDAQPAYYPRV